MLAMLCDGLVTLEKDADMIRSCDDRFDHLMETSMEGKSLMEYIPGNERGHEQERVRQAFTRAQKEPVLIPTTLISRSRSTQTVELVIVYRGSMVQSEEETVLPGFLVGIRKVSQKEIHVNVDLDITRPEERHAVCAETADHEAESYSDSQSSMFPQESLPATTYTGDVFAGVNEGIMREEADSTLDGQGQLALKHIILLGKREHWLIDAADV